MAVGCGSLPIKRNFYRKCFHRCLLIDFRKFSLKTEIIDIDNMIKDNEDKEELESYLETVKSILQKCKGDTACMDL